MWTPGSQAGFLALTGPLSVHSLLLIPGRQPSPTSHPGTQGWWRQSPVQHVSLQTQQSVVRMLPHAALNLTAAQGLPVHLTLTPAGGKWTLTTVRR